MKVPSAAYVFNSLGNFSCSRAEGGQFNHCFDVEADKTARLLKMPQVQSIRHRNLPRVIRSAWKLRKSLITA